MLWWSSVMPARRCCQPSRRSTSRQIIVPYRVVVCGKEGENYSKFVGTTFVDNGIAWGNWIKEHFPKGGNILFLSGPAGNSQGLESLRA